MSVHAYNLHAISETELPTYRSLCARLREAITERRELSTDILPVERRTDVPAGRSTVGESGAALLSIPDVPARNYRQRQRFLADAGGAA